MACIKPTFLREAPLAVKAMDSCEGLLKAKIRADGGGDNMRLASLVEATAKEYDHFRHYVKGILYWEKLLAIHEEFDGPSHPSTAPVLYDLAGALSRVGCNKDALPLMERLLALWVDRDVEQRALALTKLAGMVQEPADALLPLEEALAITVEKRTANHPDVVSIIDM